MKTRSGNVYQPLSGNVYQPRTYLHTVQDVQILFIEKPPNYDYQHIGVECTIHFKHGRSKLNFWFIYRNGITYKQPELKGITAHYYDLDIQDTMIWYHQCYFSRDPISREHLYTYIERRMMYGQEKWNLLSQEVGPIVFNRLIQKLCNNVWTTIDNLQS